MSDMNPSMLRIARDAENAWNRRDLDAVVLSNTVDCAWRNRVNFLWGREQIRIFVERQVRRELDLRVLFEPWACGADRLSTRFAAEFQNDSGIWFRVYGTEHMEFDVSGLVRRRYTSANEHPIAEHERLLRWTTGPRPIEHPSLTELGY